MLKIRVIAVLVVKDDIVVQSIGFNRYLPVGTPDIAIEYLNRWGADEIILLDIDGTPKDRKPQFACISKYSRYCHVPLAIGGGIKDVDDIKKTIYAGADKIVINTAAVKNPGLISEGARLFGNQCIVVSIDARRLSGSRYEAYMNSGTVSTGCTPVELAKKAEEYGAGEILLTSIDRDGSKKGYDLELISQVVNKVNIPIIVCGGVNHPRHFQEAVDLGVSAVAAANFFHYCEHSVTIAKSYLKAAGVNIRLDSYVTYNDFYFDISGRLLKRDDAVLEELRVKYIPEEII